MTTTPLEMMQALQTQRLQRIEVITDPRPTVWTTETHPTMSPDKAWALGWDYNRPCAVCGEPGAEACVEWACDEHVNHVGLIHRGPCEQTWRKRGGSCEAEGRPLS